MTNYRVIGFVWSLLFFGAAVVLVVFVGAWWAMALSAVLGFFGIQCFRSVLTGLPPQAVEWAEKAKGISTSTCRVCGAPISMSGTLHCQFLSEIELRDEFLVKYGVMCATHAEELARQIASSRGLTPREIDDAFAASQKLLGRIQPRGRGA